jgi:vancomycin resistance protein YoaR
MVEALAGTMSGTRRRRLGLLAAAVVLLATLVVAYALARALVYHAAVLPGVSVGGVEVGGLAPRDAGVRVEAVLAERLGQPLTVDVGRKRFTVRPDRLFALDAAATGRQAYQGARSSTLARLRLLALGLEYEVEPELRVLPAGRAAVARELQPLVRASVPARVHMRGLEPGVRPGRFGTTVAAEALVMRIRAAALAGLSRIEVPLKPEPPSIGTAAAEEAAAAARAIVSAPVAITYAGERVGGLPPTVLARLLEFEPAGERYRVGLDPERLGRVLNPMVSDVTIEPVDASFRVVGGRVRAVSSRPGTGVATRKAAEAILATAGADVPRTVAVVLSKRAADLTTREARALGIRERVSTFTTEMGESSANRIWNVQLLGRYLDGTILRPGQTFAFNRVLGPRTSERGFREGQMILGGVLVPSIGGGVCQTATTIFNAAFEAGLPIVKRKNHSFYIGHYPLGRDATVSWGGPDLVFRNDLDHAILIKAHGTPTTFTVSFYGTRQARRVVSSTSEPTNYTQPQLQYAIDPSAPPGSVSTTAAGGPGFEVNVHRKVYERGRLIREDDFFTRYVPENATAVYGPGATPPGPYFVLPSS